MGFEDIKESNGFEADDIDMDNGSSQHTVKAPRRSRRSRDDGSSPVRDRMGRAGISEDAEGDALIAPDKPIRLSSGASRNAKQHRVMKSSSEFSYLFNDEQPDDRPSKGEKAARLAALAYDEKVDGDGEKYDGILNAENPEPIIKQKRNRTTRTRPEPAAVRQEEPVKEETPVEQPKANRFSKRKRDTQPKQEQESAKQPEFVPVMSEPEPVMEQTAPEEPEYNDYGDEELMPPMYPPMPPMGYPPYPYIPPYPPQGYQSYPYMPQYPAYPVMPVGLVYPMGYPAPGHNEYRRSRQVSPHRLAVRKRAAQQVEEPMPEPVAEPIPEPVPEPIPEPVFYSEPEPIVEEPVAEVVAPPAPSRFNRKRSMSSILEEDEPVQNSSDDFFDDSSDEQDSPAQTSGRESAPRFNRRNRGSDDSNGTSGSDDASASERPAPKFNRRSRS